VNWKGCRRKRLWSRNLRIAGLQPVFRLDICKCRSVLLKWNREICFEDVNKFFWSR